MSEMTVYISGQHNWVFKNPPVKNIDNGHGSYTFCFFNTAAEGSQDGCEGLFSTTLLSATKSDRDIGCQTIMKVIYMKSITPSYADLLRSTFESSIELP